MRMRQVKPYPWCWLALSALAGACSDDDKDTAPAHGDCTLEIAPSSDDHGKVQGALIDAKEGDVICLKAGTFHFDNQLSLSANKVTLRGTDGTVLDFSKQTAGANGIEVTGNGDTVESLKIVDTKGDGVRATEVDGVTFRKLHVEWSRGPDTQNGGYGIYPVSSTHVLVENCFTSGASDTGIYVGQSNTIIIRGNESTLNVAGIEIENSSEAEAYDNYCHDNTAGLLVFNLPGLRAQGGKHANVHDNRLEQNNHENFSAPGNILNDAPAGTGLFILAADENQIHKNHISGNQSSGISVLSWYVTQRDDEGKADPKYDFYPEGNYIYDNDLSNNGGDPVDRALLIATLAGEKTIADIAWDGIIDWEKYYPDGVPENPDPGWIPVARRNCFKPGDASFINLDLEHDGKNKTTSPGDFECEHDPLPAIKL